MAINKKIIALLAIFIMIASVSVISAADNDVTPIGDGTVPEDGLGDNTGDDTEDGTEDSTEDDTGDDDTTGDEDLEVGDNPYRHGALTPNEKAFMEDGKAAGGENSNAISASGSPTTGNPILVLLAAMAILGVYPLSRKK